MKLTSVTTYLHIFKLSLSIYLPHLRHVVIDGNAAFLIWLKYFAARYFLKINIVVFTDFRTHTVHGAFDFSCYTFVNILKYVCHNRKLKYWDNKKISQSQPKPPRRLFLHFSPWYPSAFLSSHRENVNVIFKNMGYVGLTYIVATQPFVVSTLNYALVSL